MRKHNGMRPQDILVLVKIIQLGDTGWRYGDVARMLHMSQSEVAEALHRCMLARLIDDTKRNVFRQSLLEFLVHGLKYVFPAQPGALVKGIPTAHAAPPLSAAFPGDEIFVWPAETGTARGQALAPLTEHVPVASLEDPDFYGWMALLDTLRVGSSREFRAAEEEIRNRLIPVAHAR